MIQIAIANQDARKRKPFWPALPVSVVVALAWIALMLVLACFSEVIAPYGFTKLDCATAWRLRARQATGSAPTSSDATCCHGWCFPSACRS